MHNSRPRESLMEEPGQSSAGSLNVSVSFSTESLTQDRTYYYYVLFLLYINVLLSVCVVDGFFLNSLSAIIKNRHSGLNSARNCVSARELAAPVGPDVNAVSSIAHSMVTEQEEYDPRIDPERAGSISHLLHRSRHSTASCSNH